MKPILTLLFLGGTAFAAPRSSATYGIPAESADAGGRRATSAVYQNDGSVCVVGGISASGAAVAKHGYVGQLYDLTALQIAAAPATVNETSARQLSASALADDSTSTVLPATSVEWSILYGPLNSISPGGLALADVVVLDMEATVRGTFGPFTSDLTLTVLDSIPDNYGSYAGDGLLDAWQFQYFGEENPLAAPGLDPDGDGQTNLFEFTAGLSPIDPTSRFALRIEKVPGQPTQKRVVFSPRFTDRSYVVKSRSSLISGTWSALNLTSESDNDDERTVTDLDAASASKFYNVEITKP